MANVKALYIDSSGVYRPAGDSDTIDVGNIKLTAQTTANGVLSTDGSGNVSSALLDNDNVAAAAAIAGSKIDPNFGNQNIQTTGTVTGASFSGSASGLTSIPSGQLTGALPALDASALTSLNASNLASGTVPDGRFPATLPAISGANLTSLNASNLSSGTLPDGRFPASLPAIGGAALTSLSSSALSGALPALDGSALTSLNATNISSGTLDDNRLSAQVALYNAASPAFTNKLGVAAVTDADTTKAARVDYVLDKVNAAIAGLDYKQECLVYFGIPSGASFQTIPALETEMDGTTGVFTNNTRALVNFQTANIASGIYVITGSDGDWTLTRSSDLDIGANAAGAYTFCQNEYDGSGLIPYNTAMVCQQQSGSAVVGTDTLTFSVYGVGISYNFNAPLSESNGTVSLSIDSNTLEVQSNNLAVKGVPAGFYIGNAQASNAVTASNVNTLVDGTNGDASSLHRHQTVLIPYPRASAITVGKAVTVSGGNAVEASKTDGKVIGVVVSDDGSNVMVAPAGSVVITSPAGSPSQGDNLYLDSSGSLCTYGSLIANDYATKVGKYLGPAGPGGAHMIAIAVQEFGIKP